jgi:hypothetical protein
MGLRTDDTGGRVATRTKLILSASRCLRMQELGTHRLTSRPHEARFNSVSGPRFDLIYHDEKPRFGNIRNQTDHITGHRRESPCQ